MQHPEIEGGPLGGCHPFVPCPPQTELAGQSPNETHRMPAGQTHSARPIESCQPTWSCRADTDTAGDGSDLGDDLIRSADQFRTVVAEIIGQHRRYDALRKARMRLVLQMGAVQRHAGDVDPTALELWLLPYTAAMVPLDEAIKAMEKDLAKMARSLPFHGWAKGIAGLSDRFLALIQGEAGRAITDYRSPAALWKRMGMAVIDGERQRRVTGEAAIKHGYVAHRRSLMWNIGESILKQQLRKREDGERYALGYYGQVYIDRRAYETEKNGDKYSHARAKRYMEKRLLRELWKAARAA